MCQCLIPCFSLRQSTFAVILLSAVLALLVHHLTSSLKVSGVTPKFISSTTTTSGYCVGGWGWFCIDQHLKLRVYTDIKFLVEVNSSVVARKIIHTSKVSWRSLDILKVQYNIINYLATTDALWLDFLIIAITLLDENTMDVECQPPLLLG